MAWEKIMCSCGHELNFQLTGKASDREYWRNRYASEPCTECYKAERKKRIAAEMFDLGAAELVGSEKQIAWAEKIRAAFLRDIKYAKGVYSNQPDTIAVIEKTSSYIFETKSEAKWWIENRDTDAVRLVATIYKTEAHMMQKEETQTVENEEHVDESVEAAEATAEATVKTDDCSHPGAVEISVSGDTVRAKYEKDDDFRTVAKSAGFKWDSTAGAWAMKITFKCGLAEDRAAELGNALLRSGFAITIFDENIRQKAVNADFAPRCYRWVSVIRGTDSFALDWPREDNLYSAAKKIHGAKWEDGSMKVPKTSWQEVLDFADVHGFQLSPGAKDLADAQSAIAVRTVSPSEPKAVVHEDKLGAILESSREVLEDLVDD